MSEFAKMSKFTEWFEEFASRTQADEPEPPGLQHYIPDVVLDVLWYESYWNHRFGPLNSFMKITGIADIADMIIDLDTQNTPC